RRSQPRFDTKSLFEVISFNCCLLVGWRLPSLLLCLWVSELHTTICAERQGGKEMRNVVLGSLTLALCVVVPVIAEAQERVPHARSQAVGFDVGAFLPTSDTGDQLDIAPPLTGFYEYYVTPRVSLRGTAGWTRP